MFNQIFMSQIMIRQPNLPEAIVELLQQHPEGLSRSEIFHGVTLHITGDQVSAALRAMLDSDIVERRTRRIIQPTWEKSICTYALRPNQSATPELRRRGRPKAEPQPTHP